MSVLEIVKSARRWRRGKQKPPSTHRYYAANGNRYEHCLLQAFFTSTYYYTLMDMRYAQPHIFAPLIVSTYSSYTAPLCLLYVYLSSPGYANLVTRKTGYIR